MKQIMLRLLSTISLLALLSACANGGSASLIGAPLRVYDLTGQIGTIVNAEFDFIGRMGAPGRGGEVCCASLPKKWYPGMLATVRWVKDPAPTLDYPIEPKAYAEYKKRRPPYQHHSVQVELPPYADTCGIALVFFPCDQVRVVIDCRESGYIARADDKDILQKYGMTLQCPKQH